MSKRYEVKFYIGTEFDKNGDELIYPVKRMQRAHQVLIDSFGSFTSYFHTGGWGSPVTYETGVTLLVVIELNQLEYVPTCAALIRDIFRQTCVLVTQTEIDAEFV